MKKFLLLSFSLLLISTLKAQTAYDTVLTTPVGTGMTYMKIIAPAVPWSINVLKVDLKNPYTSIETAKGQGHYIGQETVSSMAERNSSTGHEVIGAVNGDFFNIGPGIPINIQVKEGQIIRGPISYPTVGFDVNNRPMINSISYSGAVFIHDTAYTIAGNNSSRGTDQLVLYNKYFGDTTGTNQYGTEIAVRPLGPWLINDTVRCVVVKKEVNIGSMHLSDTTAILSGNGKAGTFLNSEANLGDTLMIINRVLPGLPKLKEMLGGNPVLVNKGVPYLASSSREPRTAIGFSKDSTVMYLITVDGRQNASVGMSFAELSDFMLKIGVYNGLNLDGGGSTTMVIRDSVVNFPSQGGEERDVANGLLVVTSAPKGTLGSIQISPNYYKLFLGQSLQFNVQGRDQYFNFVNLNPASVTYSVDHNFGTVTQDGLFTAGQKADTGYVIADYNGMKDSCRIIVKSITKIDIFPKEATTDTIQTQSFNINSYDEEGLQYYLNMNQFKWQTTDPAVGVVDSAGNFHGLSVGTTKVIASYGDLSDTAVVHVVLGHGTVIIDSMENINDWTFTNDYLNSSGSGISISDSVFSQGNGSLKVDYNFTYDPSHVYFAYLNTSIPITGLPDSMKIDVKSDGQNHQIYYIFSDVNGQQFSMYTNKYASKTTFDTLYSTFSRLYPLSSGAVLAYPITLKQIVIKLGSPKQSGQTYSGSIYLDNLRIQYPHAVTGIKNEGAIPADYTLGQNYPNPFNPSTRIEFTTHRAGLVVLKVYDILGREVATLVDRNLPGGIHSIVWNAASFPSGVYVYILRAGGVRIAKKMVLMK